MKRIIFFISLLLLINTYTVRSDWAGEAPLASTHNALMYGATVFAAFAVGNQIFYKQDTCCTPLWARAAKPVGMAALATAINFGAIYTMPNTAGQIIVPVLNALQWRDDLRHVGFALGCVPAVLGLGMVGLFGSSN